MNEKPIRLIRWAFNYRKWEPKQSEWLHFSNCLQKEEHNRIERFVFKQPAISAMVGRLLLRKSAHLSTHLPYRDINFLRTPEGRPYLEGQRWDVNVSHHGDWVVLALEPHGRVGIDVMSLDRPINIDLQEYFKLMKRQFTEDEWDQILNSANPLYEFYRFWCLKESYVKAIGVGLNLNLQTISFLTREPLDINKVVTSTTLTRTGSETKSNWIFEETLLDTNHCVAVCKEISGNTKSNTGSEDNSISEVKFEELTVTDLLQVEQVTNIADLSTWTNFNNKQYSAR